MKPFEIFRAGRHTAADGTTADFGGDMLADVVASYDPAQHEAPIVVGHPQTDGPAYGWVGAVEVRDGRLVAVPTSVDAAFADLVRERRYSKVSASFFRPDAKNSPAPGHWYLRHVGFLGAAAPAVKGLRAVEFAADGDGVLTLEFSAQGSTARLFRRIRDLIAAWDAGEVADVPATPQFSDPDPDPDPETKEPEMTGTTTVDAAALAARAAELDAREARIKADDEALARSRRAAHAADDAAFVDQVVAEGRLPIGLKESVAALFAQLDEGTVSFADGEAEQPARAVFRQVLSGLPLPVVEGEVAKGEGVAIDFSDPSAIADAIAAEVAAASAAGEVISYTTALQRAKSKGA